MNAEERDLIRALPNRLLGIIFGIIMIASGVHLLKKLV